jgi:hypothetical protein
VSHISSFEFYEKLCDRKPPPHPDVNQSCPFPRQADISEKGYTAPSVLNLLDEDERSGLPTGRFTPEQVIKIYDFNLTHFLFYTILGVIDTSNSQFVILERHFLIDRPKPFDL